MRPIVGLDVSDYFSALDGLLCSYPLLSIGVGGYLSVSSMVNEPWVVAMG